MSVVVPTPRGGPERSKVVLDRSVGGASIVSLDRSKEPTKEPRKEPTKELTDTPGLGADDDADAVEDERRGETKADGATGPHGRRYGRDILVATVATLLAALLLPVVTPLPSIPLRIADDIRDAFRSYDGKYADDAREEVPDRDFWGEEPVLYDESFDYIAQGYPESLLGTSGKGLAYYSVPETVSRAPTLAGTPISVVGRIGEEIELGSEGTFDTSLVTEYRVAGPNQLSEVRAGITDRLTVNEASPGEVAVVHGLVVARGVSRPPGEHPRAAAYVYALSISGTDEFPPDSTAAANLLRLCFAS